MKLYRGFGLFGTSLSFGSVLSLSLTSLNWYLSFSVFQWISHSLLYRLFGILQVMVSLFGILFSLGIFLLVSRQSCVDLSRWYNLDNLLWCHTFVCLLCLLGGLFKLYLLVSWKSWACIFTICTLFGMLSFLVQYRGETPPSLKLDEMCMEFNSISICTYLCGVCPMYWCF